MTSADLLPAAVLKRKAVVYVRQSTPAQVQSNRESQRRQYELVEVARRRGFREVEVIDDDLGRSASGTVARPAGRPQDPTPELQSRVDLVFEILPEKKTAGRSEEHTSELQSRLHLVCRLLLEKKK